MTRYGFDERNLARINPVLALQRVGPELTGWHKSTTIDGLGLIKLTCDAGQHVVPHGIDADIIFALLTAYELDGRPADRVIQISLGRLCTLGGLYRSTDMYQRIQDSLERLAYVKFKVESCWGIETSKGWSWTSFIFGIIEDIQAGDISDLGSVGSYSPTTNLKIQLGKRIADSINRNHTRRVNLKFYTGLSSPLARLLYRSLQEQRQIGNGSLFSVEMKAWGEHLGFREIDKGKPSTVAGIPETKVVLTSRIRRALEPAHKELIRHNYLKEVTYVGSGQHQVINYVYSKDHPIQIVDPRVVALLTACKIAEKQANELAAKYSKTRIEAAIRKYNQRISDGYSPKNKPGFLISLLERAEDQLDLVTQSEVKRQPARKTLVPVLVEEAETLSGPTEEQAKMLKRMLQKTDLPEATVTQLLNAVMASQLPLSEVATLSACKDTDLSAQVAALLARLPTPDGDH